MILELYSFHKIIIKLNSMNPDVPLLYMFSIDWLACSLFLAHTPVACDQISLGKHVHLNG
jgi:hypothetical protein